MSRKKAEFPKIIRVGQTKATIYKTPSNGCIAFTVVWYEGPVRKRKAFADPGLAEVHANAQVNNLSQGETRALQLGANIYLAKPVNPDALIEELGRLVA